MLLVSCEADYLVSDEVAPQEIDNQEGCLFRDCATGTNPDVIVAPTEQKTAIPLLALQQAFMNYYSISTHLQRFNDDGYPAWEAINVKTIGTAYRHYLVPVYKPSSTHIEAVVSILHHLEGGFATIDYLDRDNITSFPAFTTTRLGSKTGEHMSQQYTLEATVFLLSDFDKLLFGAYDMTVVNLLDEEARTALLGKDCKEVLNYAIFDCQDVVGGENGDIPLYTECTLAGTGSELTGEDAVGCGGGTPPSGPGVGTIGSGGGGGVPVSTGGPGVIIINTDPNDPNNRCIEDGVGCDEEEEEEDKVDDFVLNPSPIDSFRLDTAMNNYPCAIDVINLLNSGLDNELVGIITSLFGGSPSVNIDLAPRYLNTVTDAVTGSYSPGPGYFTAEIYLNDRFLNRTKEHVLSTIIHEYIHAYTQFQRIQVGADSLSSVYGFTATGNINFDDHEIMSVAYVNQMADLLVQVNPNFNRDHALHLAWIGLRDTATFGALPETYRQEIIRTWKESKCQSVPGNPTSTSDYAFSNC